MTLRDKLIQYRNEFDGDDMREEFNLRVLGPVDFVLDFEEHIKKEISRCVANQEYQGMYVLENMLSEFRQRLQ